MTHKSLKGSSQMCTHCRMWYSNPATMSKNLHMLAAACKSVSSSVSISSTFWSPTWTTQTISQHEPIWCGTPDGTPICMISARLVHWQTLLDNQRTLPSAPSCILSSNAGSKFMLQQSFCTCTFFCWTSVRKRSKAPSPRSILAPVPWLSGGPTDSSSKTTASMRSAALTVSGTYKSTSPQYSEYEIKTKDKQEYLGQWILRNHF